MAGDSLSLALYRRLYSTLAFIVREYPLDPHGWYQLGEARYHSGPHFGVTLQDMRDPFARAVALDSGFVPAYRHLYELALLLDGPGAALPLMEAYLARADSSVFTEALRVSRALADPDGPPEERVTALLGALREEGLYQAWYDLKWWPDSAESAVRVARAWAASPDSSTARSTLGYSLAFRGHLREAREVMGANHPVLYSFMARTGIIPRDSATRAYRSWLDGRSAPAAYFGLAFWLADADSLALREAAGWLDSTAADQPDGTRQFLLRGASVARAYLALVQGDTAEALEGLERIPPTPGCFTCYYPALTRARVLARLGRNRESAALYDSLPIPVDLGPQADAVAVALERGRIYERLGNRDAAARSYAFVADAWFNADPELQSAVEEARAALARLAVERRR